MTNPAIWSAKQGAFTAPANICDAFIAAHAANGIDSLVSLCTYGQWSVVDTTGASGLACDDMGRVWISAGDTWHEVAPTPTDESPMRFKLTRTVDGGTRLVANPAPVTRADSLADARKRLAQGDFMAQVEIDALLASDRQEAFDATPKGQARIAAQRERFARESQRAANYVAPTNCELCGDSLVDDECPSCDDGEGDTSHRSLNGYKHRDYTGQGDA